jgi:hypothetical protein
LHQQRDLPKRRAILGGRGEFDAERFAGGPIARGQRRRADDGRFARAACAGEDFRADQQAGEIVGECVGGQRVEQGERTGLEDGAEKIARLFERLGRREPAREAFGAARRIARRRLDLLASVAMATASHHDALQPGFKLSSQQQFQHLHAGRQCSQNRTLSRRCVVD